jgi:hypothetical protein
MIVLAIFVVLSSHERTRHYVAVPRIISKPKMDEGFTSAMGQLPIGGGANPELDRPRAPYALLGDALPPRGVAFRGMTAEKCYDADWNAQNSLTGNFSKFTNNNMTTYPDNCTGPRQEFTGSFY